MKRSVIHKSVAELLERARAAAPRKLTIVTTCLKNNLDEGISLGSRITENAIGVVAMGKRDGCRSLQYHWATCGQETAC